MCSSPEYSGNHCQFRELNLLKRKRGFHWDQKPFQTVLKHANSSNLYDSVSKYISLYFKKHVEDDFQKNQTL